MPVGERGPNFITFVIFIFPSQTIIRVFPQIHKFLPSNSKIASILHQMLILEPKIPHHLQFSSFSSSSSSLPNPNPRFQYLVLFIFLLLVLEGKKKQKSVKKREKEEKEEKLRKNITKNLAIGICH